MTTLIKTATKMQFESLEEGVAPVTVSRELRQSSDDQFVQDVVVLRMDPYPELMGQPEQMQAFAEMLRQTTGSFRFGGRLECHAKLSLSPGPHERGFQLAFWRSGEAAGDLQLTPGELTSLARCIDVAAGMRVPDRGGQRRLELETVSGRFKLVRDPDHVIIFVNGTERIEGSYEAAATLNCALRKLRVSLLDMAAVWFGSKRVAVSRTSEHVLLTIDNCATFSLLTGEAELLAVALGIVLGERL